ncbi:hypothetical protein CKY06_01520 [Photorhabdus sp. S15-56]|nr:hypothetical protein [Photorhabdus laumondii subsp. laumondii]RAW75981.1 hypothetical protein CKY15_01065 [Photorhabdus sp. S7-51]RAW76472.1 hypothetical protein CKY14_01510 [Photorhabdus sp. S14-60]RAW80477.1 hypothetical protein CKY06_01520 [Photorhabdus sp. S15-56]
MRLIFALADRWGEPDPRKIAALPADVFQYWQAFFALNANEAESAPKSEAEAQCHDVMRILNG